MKIKGEKAKRIEIKSESANILRQVNSSISNHPLAKITKIGRSNKIIKVLSLPELIVEIDMGDSAYRTAPEAVSQRLAENSFKKLCADRARATGAIKKRAEIKKVTLPINGVAARAIMASQVGAAVDVPIAIECQPLK
jgi:hypothetical protein